MRIRIIKTPSGEAPIWVREHWVGVVLEAEEHEGDTYGVTTLTKTNRNLGYSVDIKYALDRLAKRSPDAANWFLGSLAARWSLNFVFGKDEVEVVES